MDGFAGGIIVAGPSVDVDDVVRGDDEMAGVSDAVGEDRGAEARRELKTAVVAGARGAGGANSGMASDESAQSQRQRRLQLRCRIQVLQGREI